LGFAFLRVSFVLHFLLPWVILFLVICHLWALHHRGSTSPLGYSGDLRKGWFWPHYAVKDILDLVPLHFFLVFAFLFPFFLRDPEMFVEADTVASPAHIVPEWYFCAQYGILRSFSRKGTGVLLLVLRVIGPIGFLCQTEEIAVVGAFNKMCVGGVSYRFSILC